MRPYAGFVAPGRLEQRDELAQHQLVAAEPAVYSGHVGVGAAVSGLNLHRRDIRRESFDLAPDY